MRFGEVYLTERSEGCALVVYPHLRKYSLASVFLDLRLVFGVIGLARLFKVLNRERLLKARHPGVPFCYLWFIGVNPFSSRKGLGTELLAAVVPDSDQLGLPVYLETSADLNLPWYQKRGFEVFDELDLGYRLYFLKRERS